MANMLLNIAGAFINQANTADVKGAVASRGQANALEKRYSRQPRAERKREREREAITKFFRSRSPFLPLSTLHVTEIEPLSFESLSAGGDHLRVR